MEAMNTKKRIYFLYARKSSENEDRQVQSIEDQVEILTALAKRNNIEIKHIYTESKSSKKPNNRPLFTEMIQRIEKGDANGILCWSMNRLFRNPVDQGLVGWLLQLGTISCIQTVDRQYLPDDNVLLFNVEGGMANQYIIELRKACMRGLQSKINKGWSPGLPPIGYLNDKNEKIIIEDSVRFPLVRQMWDMILSGKYSPKEIRVIANEKWGLRTPKLKKTGDMPICRAMTYKIFNNIYYTGMFKYKGNLYQGKHKPMITLKEFEKVQLIIGRKGIQRPKSHNFAYTGLIRCSKCGCMYTGTEKSKIVKTTGEIKKYTYFHCTRKKEGTSCYNKNSKPVTLENLEKQVLNIIAQCSLHPQFTKWAVDYLEAEKEKKIENNHRVSNMQEITIKKLENELSNLIKMKYRDLIEDDIFLIEKQKISNQITLLKHKDSNKQDAQTRSYEVTIESLQKLSLVYNKFVNGENNDKRTILFTLGSNWTINDQILNGILMDWLIPIQRTYPELEAEFKRLELDKMLTNKARKDSLHSICLRWRSTLEDVRTKLKDYPLSTEIIDYKGKIIQPLITKEMIEQYEPSGMAA